MISDRIFLLPLSMQCSGFIGAVLLGAALSLVFAVLKATRLLFCPGIFAAAAEDIIYLMFCAVAAFGFLMKFCYGRLRWYVFIGIFLGWIVFKLTVGDIIAVVLSCLLKMVIAALKAVIYFLFLPIKAAVGVIKGIFTFFAEKLNKFFKKVCIKCKFCLKKYMLALYNLLYTAFCSKRKFKGKGCERRGKKKKAQKQLLR